MKIGKRQYKSWQVWLLVFLVVVAAVVVVVAARQTAYKHPAVTPNDYHPKASDGVAPMTASSSPTPTISATSGPHASTDNAIVITAPAQGATVSDGTTVAGTATVASGVIYYRLKGVKSGQLASGPVNVTPSQPTQFSFKLGFTNQVAAGGDQGTLELYTLDSHGAETSVADVTVNISG